LLSGYQAAFWTAAGIAALGLLVTAAFLRTAGSKPANRDSGPAPARR